MPKRTLNNTELILLGRSTEYAWGSRDVKHLFLDSTNDSLQTLNQDEFESFVASQNTEQLSMIEGIPAEKLVQNFFNILFEGKTLIYHISTTLKSDGSHSVDRFYEISCDIKGGVVKTVSTDDLYTYLQDNKHVSREPINSKLVVSRRTLNGTAHFEPYKVLELV